MTHIRKDGLPVDPKGLQLGEPPTADDALAFLEVSEYLTPKQREDRMGAVHTVVRICNPDVGRKRRCDAIKQAARTLPMDCLYLNGRLFRRPPAANDISLRRFDNVVSLCRDVLRRLGRHAPELPRAEDLLPAWQELYERLSTERRKGMIAFMGYCTQEEIVPAQTTSQTLTAFEAWSLAWTLHRDPHGRARRTASSWNWAIRNIAGWPATRLALPGMRDEYTLPLEAYPASFQKDVERYLERLGCRSEQEIFPDNVAQPGSAKAKGRSPRSRREPLRDRTLTTRAYQIRQAAAALVESGIPPDQLTSLRDLVQPVERVRTILAFHRHRTLERQRINGVGQQSAEQPEQLEEKKP